MESNDAVLVVDPLTQGVASNRYRRLFHCWGLWFVLLIFVSGCAPGSSSNGQEFGLTTDEALLSIYLETQGLCSAEVSLTLRDFMLHSGQEQTPLLLDPVTIECGQAQSRQLFLGLAKVPAGHYDQISTTYTDRLSTTDTGASAPGNENSEQVLTLRFPETLVLGGGDSSCLFVTWHLDESGDSGGSFIPKLSAKGQGRQLSRDLLYVLCDELNTLYLVRIDTRFVTAAIGLDGLAGDIEIDPNRRLLYLVNRSRHSLQVFDLAAQRLVDRIPLPLTLEPYHLALDIEHNVAFVSDPLSRRVLRVKLDDGQMTANRQVGLRPGRLIYIAQEGGALVAVCAPLSQNVHLLNAETLIVQRSFETGLRPRHLLSALGRLYVSEEGSQSVTIFNLVSGRQVGQVRVVGAPGELLANPVDARVYVSNTRTNSLGVLSPGQFTNLRSIPAGGAPGALALSSRHGKIYVANPAAHSVTVLDRASETISGIIPFGGRVTDLAVLE